jgi:hypothetical protein
MGVASFSEGRMVDPHFAPGERDELLALTHALFESLPDLRAGAGARRRMFSRRTEHYSTGTRGAEQWGARPQGGH